MRAFVLPLALAVTALAMTACGGESSRVITGTFTLFSDNVDATRGCAGKGGYSDIHSGTEVRLKADEKLLDVSRLGGGTATGTGCIYIFQLKVPKGHRFYTIEVGRRGSLSYTWDEIIKDDAIQLSLGDR